MADRVPIVLTATLLALPGCTELDGGSGLSRAERRAKREAREARQQLKEARREARREEREERRQRRQERREDRREAAAAEGDEPSNCTAGYSPCLAPASDYDCAGGTGDGPEYAQGPIQVSGSDPYGLDSDGDGVACES